MDVLAGMTEDNADILTGVLIQQYQAGMNTVDEGRYQQFREGQVLGERTMITLTKDANGQVDGDLPVKMKGWASVNPQAAKAWIDALAPGTVQDTLRASWLEGLTSSNPSNATLQFSQLPAEKQLPLVNTLLSGIQDRGGLEAIRDWFDNNDKAAGKEVMATAFSTIVGRLTQKSRTWDDAAEFLKQHAGDGFTGAAELSAFTGRVAPTEPGKCLELLSAVCNTSPAIAAQADTLITQTVEHSAEGSLDILGTWLNAHREHPLYDRVVQQFARRTQAEDSEAALRWAETIKDQTLREQTRAALQAR